MLHRQTLNVPWADYMQPDFLARMMQYQSEALGQAVTEILHDAESLLTRSRDSARRRAVAYYEARDPDIAHLRDALSSPDLPPERKEPIERAYLFRVALLESQRRAADAWVDAHQPIKDKAWDDIPAQFNAELAKFQDDVKAQLRGELLAIVLDGVQQAFSGALGVKGPPPQVRRAMTTALDETRTLTARPGSRSRASPTSRTSRLRSRACRRIRISRRV